MSLWLSLLLTVSVQTAPTVVTARNHAELPVVSPDGEWVAFVSDRAGADQVFVINADGTREHPVTAPRKDQGNVQWTADGRHLHFSVFADKVSRLYEVDPDGTGEHELLFVPGRGLQIAPDGHHLVYGGGTSWTTTQFTVAEIEAGSWRHARLINDGKSIAWNAKWSPDGKSIAFTGRGAGEVLQVFVVDADGTQLRQLTHHTKAEGGAQVPAWSRDGSWIAYQVNSEGHRAHVWVIKSDGTQAHALNPHTEAYLEETPAWFPDGRRLAFQSNRSGQMEVWVMNLDATGLRQLTK